MLMQTWAMVIDAYRELCARKLFWITMALSGLVVLIFAAVGISKEGLTLLWFTLPIDGINTDILTKKFFYQNLFQGLGIGIWLSWIASILALVTTAGFFPNLIQAGSIEIHLSKPIGRLRLFLTRYLTGLLFVALQVAVFTTASFFVLGIRGGVWIPTVFLAIPIVIVFFSYLFAFCVLIGVMTRSAMPALLLTMLFWFALYIVNVGDATLVGFREGNQAIVDRNTLALERLEANTRKMVIEMKASEGTENYEPTDADLIAAMPLIERRRTDLVEEQEDLESLKKWAGRIYAVKTVLPKTAETIGLLGRWMIPQEEIDATRARSDAADGDDDETTPKPEATVEITLDDESDDAGQGMDPEAIEREFRSRSVAWIVGTSLAFEAFILGLAGFIFVRRDY